MKLTNTEIKLLISTIEDSLVRNPCRESNDMLILKDKLENKLKEITGISNRLLSNSELKNIGM